MQEIVDHGTSQCCKPACPPAPSQSSQPCDARGLLGCPRRHILSKAHREQERRTHVRDRPDTLEPSNSWQPSSLDTAAPHALWSRSVRIPVADSLIGHARRGVGGCDAGFCGARAVMKRATTGGVAAPSTPFAVFALAPPRESSNSWGLTLHASMPHRTILRQHSQAQGTDKPRSYARATSAERGGSLLVQARGSFSVTPRTQKLVTWR